MSGEAAEPTEPTAAQGLEDEIVAMFEEALAPKFESTEVSEPTGAGVR
jgi:hypothetical protein